MCFHTLLAFHLHKDNYGYGIISICLSEYQAFSFRASDHLRLRQHTRKPNHGSFGSLVQNDKSYRILLCKFGRKSLVPLSKCVKVVNKCIYQQGYTVHKAFGIMGLFFIMCQAHGQVILYVTSEINMVVYMYIFT